MMLSAKEGTSKGLLSGNAATYRAVRPFLDLQTQLHLDQPLQTWAFGLRFLAEGLALLRVPHHRSWVA
jgi:hypothetical protein